MKKNLEKRSYTNKKKKWLKKISIYLNFSRNKKNDELETFKLFREMKIKNSVHSAKEKKQFHNQEIFIFLYSSINIPL